MRLNIGKICNIRYIIMNIRTHAASAVAKVVSSLYKKIHMAICNCI